MSDERNPLLMPQGGIQTRMRGCPKCGAQDFDGKNVGGVITWTCAKCRNQWHGGLPQLPQDPTVPVSPENPMQKPSVDFVKGNKGETLELRRRINLTQEFRKGLPISEGEE